MSRRTLATATMPVRAALIAGALIAGLVPASASASITRTAVTDGGAASAPTSATIGFTTVASGLSSPVLVVSSKDGTGRLFIVEQTGRIKVRKDGAVLSTPLLDIHASVSTGGEQGLLGLAFHPSFKTNRKFYVNYTDRNGDTVIREYAQDFHIQVRLEQFKSSRRVLD